MAGAGEVGDEDPAGNVLTRGEVHASLENLKKLVIAAESYRELTTKLAKTTKQLGKCFKEYGDTKGMDSTYGEFLIVLSFLFVEKREEEEEA